MKSLILSLTLLITSCHPNPNNTKPSTLKFTTPSNLTCSATIVAPHTLLTATHCITPLDTHLIINNHYTAIQNTYNDSNDHTLITLKNITFQHPAQFNSLPPSIGEQIHFWGNPTPFTMLLRKGYISGQYNNTTLIDTNGYKGDSGAGIFNQQGKLIATLNTLHTNNSFSLMGTKPYNFTTQQLIHANIKPNPLLNPRR